MDITSEEGRAFVEEILEFIRLRMQEYQEETGNLYNLEATPAEGTTHRFAREDQKRYPDIIQAGPVGQRYYTNSSQLPVDQYGRATCSGRSSFRMNFNAATWEEPSSTCT